MGIEPTPSAWKAEVLPLNYTRVAPVFGPPDNREFRPRVVEGGGFEPPKAEPSDLQSDPFDHSGTPPEHKQGIFWRNAFDVNRLKGLRPANPEVSDNGW